MARIRVIKFKQSSSKNQPKVAYFHSKNYKKAVDSINPRKRSKNAVAIVGLNDDQMKYYIKTVGSKLNPRVVRFKRTSRL